MIYDKLYWFRAIILPVARHVDENDLTVTHTFFTVIQLSIHTYNAFMKTYRDPSHPWVPVVGV